MANRVGQQLGNYRLVRLLGHGGFAEVYLGEHLHLKSYAALKVLRTALSDEDVATFLIEGQTLACLRHPQIVRVHDFAVEQGMPFLVMDYAPRGTLRQHHPSGSCLSLDLVVTYVRSIAAALQYAHNENVIHRDVKPENTLLGDNREVLLSDFGIALFAPSPELLSTQEMAGTIPYMAPEQLRGKPCFASDQYALAIVAYEWLCGARPFEGSYWQLLNQHASALPPRLREKDPSLPEAVESVVLKALAKDPKQRYVSVRLFARALEQASRAGASTLRNDSEVTGALFAISPASPVPSRQVFISHAHADTPFVAPLQSDLQRRGITVWNEQNGNTSGPLDQENRRRKAIRAVDVIVLVVSSHTRSSPIIKEHLRIAALYQRRLVYVWAAGEDLTELLPEMGERTLSIEVIDAREPRYRLALDELVACLQEETGSSSPQVSLPVELLGEPRNPYKGLRAFTEDDTTDFFGRERLIGELVDGVEERLRSEKSGASPARLLAVIGPSGSGKSSVVMAGLLPRLKLCALPGSGEWIYLESMVPGAHPLEMLALTLAPHFPERSLKSIHEDLEDGSARGLHRLSTHLVKGSEKTVVLFIDQFEEVFNLTTLEDEREHFFALLLAAITERKGPVLVILTLRADFYDQLMSTKVLGRLISQHQLLVWPMEVDELRSAIKGPAALPDVRLVFEGNLVGDLLYEVRGQVGALPLLQFTLDQLFLQREGLTLTIAAYQKIGGVKGALVKHAEATYAALPSQEYRRLARSLFLRLIDPGMSGQDTTRRRASLTELSLSDTKQTVMIQDVADAFITARLLTTNEAAETTTIEVSHEALIREWPRLSDWLREGREDVRIQRVVSQDVVEWERRDKPKDRLYRGSQLKEARGWARRNIPSRKEATFLHASVVQRVRFVVSTLALILLLVSTAGLALRFFLLLPADRMVVTNLQDDGVGSLRQIIADAKVGATVTFGAGMKGMLVLTKGDLNLARDVTILGPGADTLAISSGKSGSIVHILSGNSVTISGLTFKNSQSHGSFLTNDGTLNLEACSISGNSISAPSGYSSDQGGPGSGITNRGALTLIESRVVGNDGSDGPLGSAPINNNGTITLIKSTVAGNKAVGDAGGLFNGAEAKATVVQSTISDNMLSSKFLDLGSLVGGGITNRGSLMVSESTISGNIVSGGQYQGTDLYTPNNGGGGGIFSAGPLILTNSTITGNRVTLEDQRRDIVYGGGGIYIASSFNPSGSAIPNKSSITFSTIVGNTTRDSGGGIYIEDDPAVSLEMRNNIIAGNNANLNPDISGTLTLSAYNLIQNPSGVTLSTNGSSRGNVIGLSPQLQSLQQNGGLTQTLALLPSSPAIDRIPLDACHIDSISTDQRGMPRPGKNKQSCDSGAYESQG